MRQSREEYITGYLKLMKDQFGHVAKSFWFYDGDLCPCCLANPIDEMIYQGKKAVSINGFMYRGKGVLIGYPLCGKCANEIMVKCRDKRAQAAGKTDMHDGIEHNLISAYQRFISSLNA